MAIIPTLKYSVNGVNIHNGSPFTSSSFTPSNNSLLVLSIDCLSVNGNTVPWSISSSPTLTWTRQARAVVPGSGNPAQADIWTAPVATGASTTVTVTVGGSDGSFNADGNATAISVTEYAGYDAVTPIGATGSTGVNGSNSGALSFSLSATTSSTSATHATSALDGDHGDALVDEGSGWTSLYKTQAGTSGWFRSTTEYIVGTTATANFTNFNTLYQYAAAAIEINAASASGSPYTLTAATGTFTLAGQSTALTYVPVGTLTAPLTLPRSLTLRRPWLRQMVPPASTFVPNFYTLTADPGAFTLTGVATLPSIGMPVSTGVFTLTGNSATLSASRVLTAVKGSFTLTGLDTPLRVGMPVTTGVFTLTGNAASLRATRALTAATGAFSLSGQAVNLIYSGSGPKLLPAATGAFTLTGNAASLRLTRVLTAVKGTFALTGNAATLRYGHVTTTAAGVFTLNGNAASLRYGRLALTAATGAFTLSGKTVNLIYSGSGPKLLPAATGAFTLTGNAATLAIAHKMACATGVFTLSGKAAGLAEGRGFTAATGVFALTGRSANLVYAHAHDIVMPVSAGVLALTGNAATLQVQKTQDKPPGVLNFGRRVTINRW